MSPGERLRQVVEEAKLADELGLEVYGIGEHHRPDMAASAPEIVLATIAGCTKTIKLLERCHRAQLGRSGTRIPEFVTLDLLSNAAGRADGRPRLVHRVVSVVRRYSLSDYDERRSPRSSSLLLSLRAGLRSDLAGQVPPAAGQRQRLPPPGRTPAPNLDRCWWHAELGRPGRYLGLPMALAIIGGRPAAFAPLVELYRKALEYSENMTRRATCTVHSHGYVFTDERAARAEFLPAYRQTASPKSAESEVGRRCRMRLSRD